MSIEQSLSTIETRDWQTTTSGTLRFALIGLGWWTVEEAIPAISDSDHCETTVLVSRNSEKADRVTATADTDTVERTLTYDEFHDGAATDAYDAVYICTPNAHHLPYAETAATLGKHVLVEKPMEASVERATALVDVCHTHDVRLAVGYRMQTEPVIRRLREAIENGAIGTPRYVHSSNTQHLLDINPRHDQWRLDPDVTGYGTSVMDLGIYSINTTRYLLDADPIAASAMQQSEHDAFEDVPDEHATFTLEFDNGTYAACTASQNAHAGTFLEVIGSTGRIRIEPAFHMETDFELTMGEQRVAVDTPTVNQMTELFDYVAHAILTNEPVSLDGEHGLIDMHAIEGIHRAATTGDRIELRDQ